MTPPVIGITLRPKDSNGGPPVLLRNRAYFDALDDAGAAVMPFPVTANSDHLRALYDRCDALCLPGGPDVQPRLYGEELRPDCNVDPDPELDGVETQLIAWAMADDKPLLAICRGLQVLNVAMGGTLWQDVSVQVEGALRHKHDVAHDSMTHRVDIEPGSRLHELTGATVVDANSRHHQAVRDPAASMVVSAHAPDGVVEGVELPRRRFVVGVQCHPEDLYATHEWCRRLFRGFVDAASGG